MNLMRCQATRRVTELALPLLCPCSSQAFATSIGGGAGRCLGWSAKPWSVDGCLVQAITVHTPHSITIEFM